MKRKILVPVFASFMALSMNGIAHADDAKTEKRTDDKKANEKNIIDLEDFKNVDYKVATVKDGVAVKVRQQGSVQTVAYAGDEFKIVGEQDGWYKVQLDDETEGWIASRYVDVKGADAYITADKVNFRKDAHVESDVQDELSLSTKVKVLETKDNWVKVKKGDQEGYIRDLYVSDKAPVVEEQETQNDAQDQNNGQVSNTEQTTNTNNNSTEESNTNNSTIKNNNNNDAVENTTNNNNSDKNTESNNNNTINKNNNTTTNNNTNNNQTSNEVQKPAEKPSKPVSDSNAASAVVSLAYSKLGSPYVWGAEGPSSFDCSGFTQYVFKNAASINLPRVSRDQSKFGQAISRNNLQKGDLIFFDTDKNGSVNHVGIYMGNNEFIHASSGGKKVIISQLNSYYSSAYTNARRVL